MNNLRECCLCSQIAGRRENDLISQLLDEANYVRRIGIESENFVAIPSLGPLVPGHTLVCPKSHLKNLAVLPNTVHQEFDAFRKRVSVLLVSLFRAPIHFFEHGSAPQEGSRVLCTVEHAHLHLVPTSAVVLDQLVGRQPWRILASGLSGLQKERPSGEYLYYESPEGERFLATGEAFESQYMRRIFAAALGAKDWNWRDNPQPR